MPTNGVIKYVQILTVLLLLNACDSETGSGNTVQGHCPTVGDLAIEEQVIFGSADRCLISGELTVSAKIPAGFNWYLKGALHVGSNTSSSNPILIIEAGTQIRGSTDGFNPDFIHVAATGAIKVEGTNDNPVILSSNNNSELDTAGGGKWGGLIIEDLDVPSDIPNKIEYLIVADAGAEVFFNSNTYRSNITLIGDHDDTTLRFVQSHDAEGDGIRLQHDTGQINLARMDWVLVSGAGRDAISYENFSGLIKDLLVIHRQAVYNDTNLVGGRAGIYASGVNSLPLIINATLVGNDNESFNPNTNDHEMGIFFAANTTGIRLANILIANFRHGCYEIESGANLSSIGLSGLTAAFVDGVHCANEFADDGGSNVQVDEVVRSGNTSDDLSNTGTGTGNGVRFYGANNINFAGEVTNQSFTRDWYLESIGTVSNGLVSNAAALNGYNNGDTDNVSPVNSDDINALPLLGNITDVFFNGVDGSDTTSDSRGYDLTHIGAVRGATSTDTQFNSWTLQDGATSEVLTNFDP